MLGDGRRNTSSPLPVRERIKVRVLMPRAFLAREFAILAFLSLRSNRQASIDRVENTTCRSAST